jgi:hypothetical protein
MNLLNILQEIEEKDPETYEQLNNRRDVLKKFTGSAGKIALAAIPLALGSLFQKAYGGPPPTGATVLDVLNFALTLEYLESSFYKMGLAASGLIPTATEQQAIMTISAHEAEHVAFLQSAITSSGGTPATMPKFDYTAGSGSNNGPFADVFTNYATFLAVAQAFEDTGVRAYKGQAASLVQGGALLTAALDIHSVEARHAAHIREMRKLRGFADVKPWITLNESGIGSVVDANYAGEQNTVQAGIQIVGINGQPISADAASEAFDEPLTMAQVLAIVKPFIAA